MDIQVPDLVYKRVSTEGNSEETELDTDIELHELVTNLIDTEVGTELAIMETRVGDLSIRLLLARVIWLPDLLKDFVT